MYKYVEFVNKSKDEINKEIEERYKLGWWPVSHSSHSVEDNEVVSFVFENVNSR